MTTRNFERADEMRELRFVAKWTLQEIADMFDMSRERVRQIIGNTGRGFVVARKKEIAQKNMTITNSKLAGLLGLSSSGALARYRDGQRHEIEGGSAKMGAEMENYVSGILNKNKIAHKLMPHNYTFDILLDNGLRVDVKTRNIGVANGYEVYSFPLRQEKRGRYADFFICVMMETKDIFVIPAAETSINSQIRINRLSDGKSKWHKYHNRFDLLK